MHDAMAVNAIEGRRHLRAQQSYLRGVDWPVGDHVRDGWAGDVLHHQVWAAGVSAVGVDSGIEDGHQIGVRQAGQHPGLAVEAFLVIWRARP
jgi:hypothetical protein